jgi:hypothetical protein
MNKRISSKYCCRELHNLILNINDFARELMPITGGGSLEEWANYFGLPEQGISLRGLFRFLQDHCCIQKCKEKNLIQLNHENLFELQLILRETLSKTKSEWVMQ